MEMRPKGRVARCAQLVVSSLCLSVQFAAPLAGQQQIASADDLARLSIEELANLRVTSVSKSEEPLSQAAAAVYVITDEAIRRSGASSIPEILRLAPNLHVARLDANTYAISARGFNQSSGTANKLLVLIDGRAVYSPLFSGTFWDAQKTMIGDIDRIEVISGPGGALWGGNAVNGVINIITKDAIRTRGTAVEAQAGTLDRILGARYGASVGATGSYRFYGLGVRQGSMVRPDGGEAGDDWNHVQAGFRSDYRIGETSLTLQGDACRGTGIGRPARRTSGEISGANLSATLERQLDRESSLRLQAYADTARRLLVSAIDARVDQVAVEGQVNLSPTGRHRLVLGGGYRTTSDRFQGGPGTAFLDPADRRLGFANVFAQDSIALTGRLRLNLGLKLEHNSYTGVESMPDLRIAWSASPRAMVWAAASRAVRIPSRFDTDLFTPGVLAGGPRFDSEDLLAWEAGYRALLRDGLSLSVSAFHNSYSNLRTVEGTGPQVFPLQVRNNMEGSTSGIEAWGDLAVREWWRVSAGAALLRKDLRLKSGSRDVFGVGFSGNDPRYHWSLRSSLDLPRAWTADLGLRGTGELQAPAVDARVEADARIGWRASDAFELSLSGQNLLRERHREFVNPSIPASEVPRSFAVMARWTP